MLILLLWSGLTSGSTNFILPTPAEYASTSHANQECLQSYAQAVASPASTVHFDLASVVSHALANGLPAGNQPALTAALSYVSQNAARLNNQNYVAVADYTQPGVSARFYLVHLPDGTLESVAVGQGTGHVVGPGGACAKPAQAWTSTTPFALFSNEEGTCLSAKGCVLVSVAENRAVFWGSYFQVHGLNVGSNDQSCNRGIWLHSDPRADFAGDSMGCFAVPQASFVNVASRLKGAIVCTNPLN